MIKEFTESQKKHIALKAKQYGLSKTESMVYEQVLTGKINKEAAASLFVAEKTAKFHLVTVFKKLNIKYRSELVWTLDLIWPKS